MKNIIAVILLTLMGSLIGIVIYSQFFEEKHIYYIRQETLRPTFSRYVNTANEPSEDFTSEQDLNPNFVFAANKARPAVVHVRSRYEKKRKDSDFFSNPWRDYFEDDMYEGPQGVASGSGVLISPHGYIATNNHVIEHADEVEVTLFDNRSFNAKIVGTDKTTDLALLKIEGDHFPYLSFGNSDEIQVGQWVLAVGNPMDLTFTVTAGIVSAKGRNMNLLRKDSQYAIESFIQTDAVVNRGNSGGALVNSKGQLIGINTAIASRTGFYAGYSFAIPSTIAQKVMEDLLTFGDVKRAILGVSIRQVDADLAQVNNLSVLKGAYVSDVTPSSGAHEAGIKAGDVIISVNNVPVESSPELQEQVSRYRPGDKIRVEFYRGTQKRSLDVVLRTIDGTIPNIERKTVLEYKNTRFRLLNPEEYQKYEVSSGILIEKANQIFQDEGIENGFLITEINNQHISSLEQLENALSNVDGKILIRGRYKLKNFTSFEFDW